LIDAPLSEAEMSAWSSLGLHSRILKALADKRFAEPTPIQLQSIPVAISFKKDVVGAAETVLLFY
jgi:superfamily II DNA/RNA helicase